MKLPAGSAGISRDAPATNHPLLLCPQMLSCLEHMYHDLGLVRDFSINPITLRRWLVRAGPSRPSAAFLGNGPARPFLVARAFLQPGVTFPRAFWEDMRPASVHLPRKHSVPEAPVRENRKNRVRAKVAVWECVCGCVHAYGCVWICVHVCRRVREFVWV